MEILFISSTTSYYRIFKDILDSCSTTYSNKSRVTISSLFCGVGDIDVDTFSSFGDGLGGVAVTITSTRILNLIYCLTNSQIRIYKIFFLIIIKVNSSDNSLSHSVVGVVV